MAHASTLAHAALAQTLVMVAHKSKSGNAMTLEAFTLAMERIAPMQVNVLIHT